MGYHCVLVIGRTVVETFNPITTSNARLRPRVRALQTGRPLRVLPDAVAEKTVQEWEAYPGFAENHF